ncbi:MAG: 4-(cytidine 5'-diphospho)-2-C-methyl-D-erythritol kinase [Acidobacteriaceae bacterium]
MPTRVRSYSKINLGLAIGPTRADGFHGLTTLYQTLELHDVVTVSARRLGAGAASVLTLESNHPKVPTDATNTCWKMVERCLIRMGIEAEVSIHIQKNLPVQGGLGAGSANAVAALIGLEHELNQALPGPERLELAAEIGSDVPLFLLGGAVLGLGRGEEVYPMPDLPATWCVVVAPPVGVSTPQAFRDWDALHARSAGSAPGPKPSGSALTNLQHSDRLKELSRTLASVCAEPGTSGVFSVVNRTAEDLAENPLLALVRTGIENDFEEVVFPQHPSLREIKRLLVGSESGQSEAVYAALSGSGSALFGLYRSREDAEAAQQRVLRNAAPGAESGIGAFVTKTLPRAAYWRSMFA